MDRSVSCQLRKEENVSLIYTALRGQRDGLPLSRIEVKVPDGSGNRRIFASAALSLRSFDLAAYKLSAEVFSWETSSRPTRLAALDRQLQQGLFSTAECTTCSVAHGVCASCAAYVQSVGVQALWDSAA